MKTVQMKMILVAAVLGLTACGKEGAKNRPEDHFTITASDKSSAEDLAASSEQLVTPYSFMLAYKIAQMALKKDPNNLKAQFYSSLLKRFEALRGVAARIRPMLTPDQLQRLDAEIAAFPASPLKDFLMEAGPAINSEADVQQIVENYFSAVGELRKFLKDNENTEMVLNFNPYIFQQQVRKELAATYQATEKDGTITVRTEKTLSTSKKMNIADFIAFRQVTAGELLGGLFSYSYNFSGAVKVLRDKNGTAEQNINALFANSDFGKLRVGNGFSQLANLGSDASAATAWVLKYQETLCPQGKPLRPGFLVEKGLCVSDAAGANRALALLDSALKGVIDVAPVSGDSKIKLDAMAWSKKPIADLRSVAPKFSAKGCVSSFADNTLGGLYIDNNASSALLPPCAE